MYKYFIPLLATAALAIPQPALAAGGGLTPRQLVSAGWGCVDVPNHGYHCTPPGVTIGVDTHIPVLVFGSTLDSPKIGTEMLIRKDAFNGQPCPQDGGQFVDLEPLFGLPYMACHHVSFFSQ